MSFSPLTLYQFDSFYLDPSLPLLLHNGKPVQLPPKVLETLVVLVQRGGYVVKRAELIEAVWPDTVVEENNLSVNISLLRKALGDGVEGKKYIETVPRRGYRFTAGVRSVPAERLDTNLIPTEQIGPSVDDQLAETPSGSLTAVISAPVTRRSRRPRRFVVALAVLIVGVGAGFYFRTPSQRKEAAFLPAVRSIAVLPVKAITKNKDDEALTLGLADSLITRLASSQRIVVRPLSSVTRHTNAEFDPLEVGRKLQVDAILDASFQRNGNRLRVGIRLLRVIDGRQIWSETFDEVESDIFKLQDAVALKAASALALNLNQLDRALVLKRYTDNVEAYQAYSRGRYFFANRFASIKNLDLALAEYERAFQLDPDYALAYAGLADAYSRKANLSSGNERRALYEKAKATALKALALDENLAEAHAALGWIRRIYDWDWVEAEKHLRRAIDLAPNEAASYHLYVFLLITLGRTKEAVAYARRITVLDPTNISDLAFALKSNRQVDEAITEYLKCIEMNTEPTAWHPLAELYLYRGNYVEALHVVNRIPPEEKETYRTRALMTMVYFHAGEKKEALEMLSELEVEARATDGRDARLAAVYALLGRKEEAIASLQKGLATRDDRMVWIKTNQQFDSLRDDTRFQEILRKMNLASR